MAVSKVDMSLEDIIKEQRNTTVSNRGRGGFQRGRGRFGVRGNRIVKPGQRFSGRPGGFRSFRRGSGFRGRAGFSRGRFNSNVRAITDDDNSSKLSISNLDFGVNDNDIKEMFGEFGEMTKASVNYNLSGRSLGTALVIYTSPANAKAAASHYNDVPLDGRPMRVQVVGDSAPAALGFRGGRFRGNFKRFQRTKGSSRGGFGKFSHGRGRGRGGKSAPPSKEDLDKQLEQYSASAS